MFDGFFCSCLKIKYIWFKKKIELRLSQGGGRVKDLSGNATLKKNFFCGPIMYGMEPGGRGYALLVVM